MEDFHVGPYETAVARRRDPDRDPAPGAAAAASAYEKVERRAGDWAVVSAGAAVWLDGGLIADARVGLAAVGPNTTGIPAISAGAARAGARRRSCTSRPGRSRRAAATRSPTSGAAPTTSGTWPPS